MVLQLTSCGPSVRVRPLLRPILVIVHFFSARKLIKFTRYKRGFNS